MHKRFGFIFAGLLILTLPSWAEISPARRAEMKEIMETSRSVSNQLMEYGEDRLKKGDFTEAMRAFHDAADSAPYDYRPYWSMIQLYMSAGRFDEAYRVMERAGAHHLNSDALYALVDQLDRTLVQSQETLPYSVIRLADFKDDKRCAVSFNFDDGAKQVYTSVLPIFERFRFRATIPVNAGAVALDSSNPVWASWEDLIDADSRGFEIANHSLDHVDLTAQTSEGLSSQINQGYDLITQKIGHPPVSFIFPFNKYHEASMVQVARRHQAIRQHDYLKQVYPHIFLAIYGGNYFSVQTANRLVGMAARRRLWMVVEAHSIQTEIVSYKPITEDFLVQHLSYLKEHEDTVWVDTFGRVYRYLAMKKSAWLEILEQRTDGVIFRLSSDLVLHQNDIPLTVVVDPGQVAPGVVAQWTDVKESIPVTVRTDGTILLDLRPDGRTVRVDWVECFSIDGEGQKNCS